MTNKPIALFISIIIIIAAILYLETSKLPAASVSIPINVPVATTSPQLASDRTKILEEKSKIYPSAVELVPGGEFINRMPFKLSDLIGKKVILVDFWTYNCINCIRTLPYLKSWYDKYEKDGLVIVGVHTPEFDFEKDPKNVSKAVKNFGINYPVMQDNNYGTWTAYKNEYWPREYLIDIDGFIVHDHAGEGSYDETEKAIQAALKERASVLNLPMPSFVSAASAAPAGSVGVTPSMVNSPETYFGSARNEYLANGEQGKQGKQTLKIPETIDENRLYLGGTWNFSNQYAESLDNNEKIAFKYDAKNVYLVASSPVEVNISVFLDGEFTRTVTIKDNKLYTLIEGENYGTHRLELQIPGSGLRAFTFTFG